MPLVLGRTVFLVCLFANAALMLSLRVYPFVDLPFHLAAATIYRDYRNASSLFPSYFTIRSLLVEPNVLHLVMTGLPLDTVASVDTMNRLVLCGYVTSLPLIVRALIRRLGGNGWFALLAFPLVFNFNVAWGFAGFVMAIPLVLLLLYAVMDRDRYPWRAAAAAYAGALVLLFYTHVLAMLFAAVVLVMAVAARAPGERRPWWILPAILPAVGLTCWWWLGRGATTGEGTLHFLVRYYRSEYFQHFIPLRRRILTNDNTQLFAGAAGVAMALALAAPIVGPPIVALARQGRQIPSLLTNTPRRALAAFTLAAFACCMLLPDRIPDQTALYERFGVFFLLSMVLWSSVLYPRVSGGVLVALCLVALGSTAVRVSYFVAFARHTRDFTPALLPAAAPGRTLLGVIPDPRFRGHPAYRHFPDYYIVWRRGIAATELTQFRFGIVRANPRGATLPRFEASPNTLDFSGPQPRVDYLLVQGPTPPDTGAFHQFVTLRTAGDWRVYQNQAPPGPNNRRNTGDRPR